MFRSNEIISSEDQNNILIKKVTKINIQNLYKINYRNRKKIVSFLWTTYTRSGIMGLKKPIIRFMSASVVCTCNRKSHFYIDFNSLFQSEKAVYIDKIFVLLKG